jgi:RecA/RadA recombinase
VQTLLADRTETLASCSPADRSGGDILTAVSANQDDLNESRVQELEVENAELRRRIELVDTELDALRAESLQRRQEVRTLAESLPTAESRKVLLSQMANDLLHHPDKKRMVGRAFHKLARGPRKLVRAIKNRLSPSATSP